MSQKAQGRLARLGLVYVLDSDCVSDRSSPHLSRLGPAKAWSEVKFLSCEGGRWWEKQKQEQAVGLKEHDLAEGAGDGQRGAVAGGGGQAGGAAGVASSRNDSQGVQENAEAQQHLQGSP